MKYKIGNVFYPVPMKTFQHKHHFFLKKAIASYSRANIHFCPILTLSLNIYILLSNFVDKKFLFFLHEGLLGWGRSDLEISGK